MAALSGGAHVQLDDASGDRLRELLKSAVRFVLGGVKHCKVRAAKVINYCSTSYPRSAVGQQAAQRA